LGSEDEVNVSNFAYGAELLVTLAIVFFPRLLSPEAKRYVGNDASVNQARLALHTTAFLLMHPTAPRSTVTVAPRNRTSVPPAASRSEGAPPSSLTTRLDVGSLELFEYWIACHDGGR
jgi:cell division septation protein DedD